MTRVGYPNIPTVSTLCYTHGVNHPSLNTPIKDLGPIGRRCAKALGSIGLKTAEDLLWHLPSRYEDFRETRGLAEAGSEPVTVRVRIDMIRSRRSPRKRMLLTEATVSDDTGSAKAVWFRQPFITRVLKPGDEVMLSGRVQERSWGLEMTSPTYEKVTGEGESVHTGRLVPVYPLTGTVTAKQLRALIHSVLSCVDDMEETLDPETVSRLGLMSLPEAMHAVHRPSSESEVRRADRRIRFEELFRTQIRGEWARRELGERRSPEIPFDETVAKTFVGGLPFTLTDDQKKVSWRIMQDMASGASMQRLVEGDVGSGKTAVAAFVMRQVAAAGYGSVYLAPTEILASQHAVTLSKLLGSELSIGLLTRTSSSEFRDGSEEPLSKTVFRNRLAGGEFHVTVGTHALLEEKLAYGRTGLLVVDEQHRFGVGQRHALLARLEHGGLAPHFLSMTATPIPRTLSLAMYGDVGFSALRQMPAGRKEVETIIVDEEGRSVMYDRIREEISKGHKAFVVCPLIEPSDALGVKSAQEELDRLRFDAFPDLEIGLLHGKLKGEEKREVMERFAEGDLPIVVSTTVVEVGVDVPKATVMVIEGAERFGLAQLHQLRGRVGRSDRPSVCFLAPSSMGPNAVARLEGFAEARDCFDIAELDLQLRGPGDIFGDSQSGFLDLKRFDPTDLTTVREAKEAAAEIFEKDPHLDAHPSLKALVTGAKAVHLE